MSHVNIQDYEKAAQALLEPAYWDYYAGGSDDEITLRANRAIFDHIRLRPRILKDVTTCDTTTTALGTPLPMPIIVAPTACHNLAHPEGECETVRGVSQAGTIMTASSVSSRSLEEIAEAASTPLWFQLYIYQDRSITINLLERARQTGYRAIVLTVDVPRLGNRERDLRNNFKRLDSANFVVNDVTQLRRSLTWKDITWLRSLTPLPLLIKGILTAEDAIIALEHGVDGIIVSNHGGRQLDGAISGLEALPEIVEAVAGRCEIYVDGGIRRGTDVLKALALGARAVLVGRPILWGLTVKGQDGVNHILELLKSELELAMALCGCPTLNDITPSLVKL
ncbi:alpha-hydroxy acid oxidase [Ktedonospora formicarum]|uniref:Alpha-hydroxy-acid oxidizing enzyme n=1 Tax=Ktedonospora formicarum TaxID=2778364 RepID=A0A8J3ICL6_9CHLR|nr:alpha-hydroxy acid oxidase [Ktedonospora formicarum]GHO50227.1 alpha-hydroxy-acid oxidizing enzyme [Ktedonospora formicarum]